MNEDYPSDQLTQALAMEEYHREQLLKWKQCRQRLETEIPDLFKELLEELADDDQTITT